MNKKNGFVIKYIDDFNMKHITYTTKFSDVKYIKERYNSPGFHYEPAQYYAEKEQRVY